MPLTTVSQGLLSTDAQYTGFKNRIINGAMMIDQRNAGASVTLTGIGLYLTDRWQSSTSQASKLSAQQNAGSVTPPTGFTNYLGFTSLSAYSITSSDYFFTSQPIEGFNVADLGWGSANASSVSLSFWVRSSLTGTFSGSLRNSASNRSYIFSYTISSANTWEQKTVTIAGDTTGTWLTNNGRGITVTLCLGSGSTRLSTANSWQVGDFDGATGTTSVVGTNGATFYITGVQLEKGSTATSFDYRPYGTELALCQRYFTHNFALGEAPSNGGSSDNRCAIGTIFNGTAIQTSELAFKVSMRAIPTITFFRPSFVSTDSRWAIFPMAWGGAGFIPSLNSLTQDRLIVGGEVSGGTSYYSYIISGYYTASAEL